ncbi:MAG: Mrp/NBP35 family ATP-binding protein [Candidatus Xenobia bacterium]
MAEITKQQVEDALRTVPEPELGGDLVSRNMIRDITIDGGKVAVTVMLTTPACPMKKVISDNVEAALKNLVPGVTEVVVNMGSNVPTFQAHRRSNLSGVRNVIAVASGKGGVGKSTFTTLMALALSQTGAKVGLLDADIYGPSIPKMMGVEGKKPNGNNPIVRLGIKLMSMGFMLAPNAAAMWRGPMVSKAIQEFIYNVEWGELDYLLVDLPPGTGDAQITLCQQIPLAGVVIVTTPQEVAATIASKAMALFREMKVPLLGVVENMSYFVCDGCSKQHEIFGRGGGEEMARVMGVPMLGQVPLVPELVSSADMGEMERLVRKGGALSERIVEVSEKVAARVSVGALAEV